MARRIDPDSAMKYDAVRRPVAIPIRPQPEGRRALNMRGTASKAAEPNATRVMTTRDEQRHLASFEAAMLPHLDAAYNLARWIARSEMDAQDIVQEAYLRAFRFFSGFNGGDGRGWLMAIVRNTSYTWMQRNRGAEPTVLFDENAHSADCACANPEAELLLHSKREAVQICIQELPVEFREMIVLRELEGMSYREIAEAAAVPVGTVVSRLARARKRLEQCLIHRSIGHAG